MLRRDFLKIAIISALAAACSRSPREQRIGVALGGGGAKGLAHILMLEVLDELGIQPYRMAGTSIGAVIATLYAAGMSGRAIRALVDELTVSEQEGWFDSLFNEDILRWMDFIEPRLGRGGLIESEAFIAFLRQRSGVSRFEQLRYPLAVVAADFWRREQVVFRSGDLMMAVKASMAVPGLFTPVEHGGRVLVDGGLVNPVPYDLLLDECDITIAIDVLGQRTPDYENGPSYFETTFNSFQIMQAAIIDQKRQCNPPQIYIKPDIRDIRVLEFYKAGDIYRQAQPAQRQLREQLQQAGLGPQSG